jgi:hypothetical protein
MKTSQVQLEEKTGRKCAVRTKEVVKKARKHFQRKRDQSENSKNPKIHTALCLTRWW